MDLCFYCFALVPLGAESCANCGVPVFILTAAGRRKQVRRLGGAMASDAATARAVPRLSVKATTLPQKIDLRADCSAVEDQGQLMSCCANASVGAFEHYRRVRGEYQMELSRLFVYYTGRRNGGHLPKDDGVRVREVMGALAAWGAPEESRWPYVPENVNTVPTEEVFSYALSSRPKEFGNIAYDGVLHALARGFPVVINLSVGAQTYREAATSGHLRAPKPEELAAGKFAHALLIVGYDLEKDEYILRNSWGTGWGDKGYCRASFNTIETYSWFDEFWILGDLDEIRDAPNARAAASAPTRPEPSGVVGMADKLRDEIRSGLKKDVADSIRDIRDRLK